MQSEISTEAKLVKFLFDFFPIIVFFGAYKLWGIYTATYLIIAASVLQVCWSRIQHGYFQRLPLITLLCVLVFGGATLFFRNELFIKWKPTAVYWLLSAAFLISQYMGDKPLIARLLSKNLTLKQLAWQRLNLSWVFFFAFMGALNLYVVQYFDTDTWVNFKLFGSFGLTFLFALGQGIFLMRNRAFQTDTEKS